MLFWLIAIAVTAIACAALYYAAGWRVVNADTPESDDANSHFRLVLAGIDADLAAGKLGESEATAAKGELAREILRLKAESGHVAPAGPGFGRGPLLGGLLLVGLLAFAVYGWLGKPDLPSQPLSGRADVAAQQLDLDTAIARIEEQLAATPDDLRGWTVIAPAYVEQARYADAIRAYRRVIELGGATPDLQTSLAEALLLEGQDTDIGEATTLLQAAAAADPSHVMSRLYLASVLTGAERYAEAVPVWTQVLALAKGDEPWLASAQQGLAVAQNGGVASTNDQEAEMIGQMVSGLAERLAASGGTIEEWTQLVRAYLVLGDTERAQAAFDDAVAAYPQAFDRGDLDTLALGAGLTINGAQP
ncbi:c-type cytochrome biogenesis protein CcmI [Devosia oryziradicis]|uniref:C-type cytochrome biogenesis protein CcmI n=1 Tax=Devosia oryziradicis TaxID=2801335 RepID=A0ABX7BVQ5_9HYPH|nr:c-type cytochrome biogenesis protein CcmI [Devosia oryziradicis]QQR35627.1 c-type cytochrome biogenesis protein CcmI [Devosia oryziradicis]